ncbi:DUF2461 domain-containing protein [Fulvivirga sediminis]|uniref:DUF2461 domain-containing protein n=1 Tax=Fulvivirga sediminis TaxID=2803949 RepID=A0A937F5K0_9BACT|nr:DUF2461 domain-containing protein [Fulvivirga sediminis]MBL3654664.1 DUF2461 domain-containing protein [Fulvivirga sediminis]
MALEKSLNFLTQLNDNNDRDWMQANKPAYQAAREEFISFVGEVILKVASFDPSISGLEPKQCIFRINRDIRFSKDKRPYKNNFGMLLNEGGKKSGNAGYYLHIQPGNQSFIAGGLYSPDAERLAKVRQEIDYNPEELKDIISDASFQKDFGSIQGDSLKRAPKGYDESHPNIELLKLKSYIVLKHISDNEVKKWTSADQVVERFQQVEPVIRYLNVAIS